MALSAGSRRCGCADAKDFQRQSEFDPDGLDHISVVARIHFPTNGANLDDQDRSVLNQLVWYYADFLIGEVEVSLVFWGHTDFRGSRELNQRLGWARADAVRSYVDSRLKRYRSYHSRIHSYGKLYATPVCSGDIMAQDRCVMILTEKPVRPPDMPSVPQANPELNDAQKALLTKALRAAGLPGDMDELVDTVEHGLQALDTVAKVGDLVAKGIEGGEGLELVAEIAEGLELLDAFLFPLFATLAALAASEAGNRLASVLAIANTTTAYAFNDTPLDFSPKLAGQVAQTSADWVPHVRKVWTEVKEETQASLKRSQVWSALGEEDYKRVLRLTGKNDEQILFKKIVTYLVQKRLDDKLRGFARPLLDYKYDE
jgi:hypothetical protein